MVGLATVAGDTAFETLLEPLLPRAYDLAFAMLRDRGAAEDAVQEGAVRAWRSFGRLRDQSKVRQWFLKIILNQCRATMRTRWRRSHLLGDHVDQGVPAQEASTDLRIDLERALRQLNRDQRAVLYLFFEMDLSHEDIARVLGVRLGTVKSRLHRAVNRLREGLDVRSADDG